MTGSLLAGHAPKDVPDAAKNGQRVQVTNGSLLARTDANAAYAGLKRVWLPQAQGSVLDADVADWPMNMAFLTLRPWSMSPDSGVPAAVTSFPGDALCRHLRAHA